MSNHQNYEQAIYIAAYQDKKITASGKIAVAYRFVDLQEALDAEKVQKDEKGHFKNTEMPLSTGISGAGIVKADSLAQALYKTATVVFLHLVQNIHTMNYNIRFYVNDRNVKNIIGPRINTMLKAWVKYRAADPYNADPEAFLNRVFNDELYFRSKWQNQEDIKALFRAVIAFAKASSGNHQIINAQAIGKSSPTMTYLIGLALETVMDDIGVEDWREGTQQKKAPVTHINNYKNGASK